MINYEVKFLICDESVLLKGNDYKSYKYETKKRSEQTVYDSGKRSYCERRGGNWRNPHPRQLRQLESKLRDRALITCEWTNDTLITIVFSSGAIAYLTVKPATLDVTQILFDRYFVGKFSGQIVTNVAICSTHMLFIHNDRLATLVTFAKNKIPSLPCRVNDRDPHLQSIELGGGSRRSERHVSSGESNNGVHILVWSFTVAEPAPWSPIIEDHANLHLYTVSGQHISLTAYHQLENETLSAELSIKGDIVHIIEQVNYHKNGVSLDWLRYEAPAAVNRATNLSSCRESATRVSLSVPVRTVCRSPCDTRLLAACIDGSLHIVHHAAGLTHTTRAGFIATEIRWAGELVVAAEEGGRLQCFDRALSLLHYHAKCLDLTTYLRESRRMHLLANRIAKGGPLVLASFSGGPLVLLHITHPRLLTAWIRVRRMSNAVALLRAMDWDQEGTDCLWVVNKLVCTALRAKPGEGVEEGVAQAAVGAYLAPVAPHSPAALRYSPPVHDLARKFFHHLLRRGRIEKALSLAVDLAAGDLFADARWAATRLGLPHLADEAAGLAAHYSQHHTQDSECSESCSGCSSHSYTGSEDDAPDVKTKPPPLPRVPLPNPPTLMQVPIAQTEPISTNSIRPNLHQYLERDNTIWTKDLRDNNYVKEVPKSIERDNTIWSKDLRDDTYVKQLPKSILNLQNARWHSMDVLSNYRPQKHNLLTVNEDSRGTHAVFGSDERATHLYQKELRGDAPNTLYRYQNNNNNYRPNTSVRDRGYRIDNDTEKHGRGEKNKVKFSDTITIAVVSDPMLCPEPARELADSLPLCPPHKYLSAFAPHVPHVQHMPHVQHVPHAQQVPHVHVPHAQHVPHPQHVPPAPAGTTLDYVEV